MTTIVNVHEARTHFSKLLERVMNGEQITIAKANKPVAILSPVTETPPRRIPGIDIGRVFISPDFDAPLPEFDL